MTPFILLILLSFSLSPSKVHSDLPATVHSDLPDEKQALLVLRAAVAFQGRAFLWDTNQPTPCNWVGITCKGGHVTAIRLPSSSLAGPIPVGIFRNLTHLSILSLRYNALTGPLPADLGDCVELRNLYLQGNNFSGPIPEFFFNLKSLARINLSGNAFTGEVPTELNRLRKIRTLLLDNNQFNGTLPELNYPQLEQFNVSNNLLTGYVPESLRSQPASAFCGNALCGPPLHACPEIDPLAIVGIGSVGGNGTNGNVKKKNLSIGGILGIVVGSVVGFSMILLIVFLLFRKKGRKGTRSVDVEVTNPADLGAQDEKMAGEGRNGGGGGQSDRLSVAAAAAAVLSTNGKVEVSNNSGATNVSDGAKKLVFFGVSSKEFDLEDLLRASAEVLGKGVFGTAYKAVMDHGLMMVVKRLKDVAISEREFREKIELVGAMENENIAPLRAYYYCRRDEKLLVYDYMPMGSLSALLHENKGSERTPLTWNIRSSIALGAARGIAYLHSLGPTISHGNIKSSNILLTKSYEARVSDFGLTHLVSPFSMFNQVSAYRAPEVTDPRKVSQQADVYSFGVLLLELLTGKAPTLSNEEGVDLPKWVQSIAREEWKSEVFDVELLKYQNAEEQMVQLLQLALECSDQYADNRPSMSEVADRIDEIRCASLEYYDSVQVADDNDSFPRHRDPHRLSM